MHLVRVDGPVGEELRQHGSKESKEGSRSANRDVVPDEQRGKHAASNARNNVDDTDSHCKENGNACSDSDSDRHILGRVVRIAVRTISKLLLESESDEHEAEHIG